MILIYAEAYRSVPERDWRPLGTVASQDEATRLCAAYADRPVVGAAGRWHVAWIEIREALTLDQLATALSDGAVAEGPASPEAGDSGYDSLQQRLRQGNRERDIRRLLTLLDPHDEDAQQPYGAIIARLERVLVRELALWNAIAIQEP